MSEYFGKSKQVRVRIKPTGTWAEYAGQECDAIIYDGGVNPHLNTEQLNPPLRKWQQAKISDIEVIG